MAVTHIRRICLRTGDHECRILTGSGLALAPDRWSGALKSCPSVCLVTDRTLHVRLGRTLARRLSARVPEAYSFLLPPGEKAKDLRWAERLWTHLLKRGMGRDGMIVALGGGSVTDTAGFAASAYMRGIRWISIPTTLLGQVDSGIGGKTGVNLRAGKNMVGAFHQPEAVICDPEPLRGLPKRQIVSGLGEVLKYGLIFSPTLFSFTRGGWDRLLALERPSLLKIVARCASWKAKVVAQDERDGSLPHMGPASRGERDTRARREILNFGHTVGHALESATGHKVFLHGEALVWGMRAAVELSKGKRLLAADIARDIDAALSRVPVPRIPAGLRFDRLWAEVNRDKKRTAGVPRFVLLKGIGRPVARGSATRQELMRALKGIGA